ncbi:hypothetical protein [Streptomyces turgidiscabies]|uniref:hypothetical protein n=1 Tax=Streptomyces turgidiscabies TaxID=85558 RepID=UPI0038F644C5
MNAADELRAAAKTLRQRAEAATPGPWKPDHSIPYGHRVGSSDDSDWVAWTGEYTETGSEADASYIATMGPTVGKAIVELLERAAKHYDDGFLCCEHGPDSCSEVVAPALAVARAINRSQP